MQLKKNQLVTLYSPLQWSTKSSVQLHPCDCTGLWPKSALLKMWSLGSRRFLPSFQMLKCIKRSMTYIKPFFHVSNCWWNARKLWKEWRSAQFLNGQKQPTQGNLSLTMWPRTPEASLLEMQIFFFKCFVLVRLLIYASTVCLHSSNLLAFCLTAVP